MTTDASVVTGEQAPLATTAADTSVETGAVTSPEGAKKPFEFNDDVFNAIPEDYREHVKNLVGTQSEYQALQEKLGNNSLDDLLESHGTLGNYFDYLDQNGVEEDALSSFVESMALVKSNPEEGVKALEEFINNIKIQQGLALYPDLQAALQKGEVSEAFALEIQKNRLLQTESQKAQQSQQQSQIQQAQYKVANEIKTVLDGTEFAGKAEIMPLVANVVTPWLEQNNYAVSAQQLKAQIETVLKGIRAVMPQAQSQTAGAEDQNKPFDFENDPTYQRATPEEREILKRINQNKQK